MQILDKFKDIDARWLIFGEGYMFGSIENGLLSKFMRLLEIEKYVSVMSEDELTRYVNMIQSIGASFTDSDIMKWREMLALKNSERDRQIYDAMSKNNELNKLKDIR